MTILTIVLQCFTKKLLHAFLYEKIIENNIMVNVVQDILLNPSKYSRQAPRAVRPCVFLDVRSKFSDDPDRPFHPRFSTCPDTGSSHGH
jgi:hypothetical protein